MSEILRSTPATLELNVYSEGTLVDLDANPTVVITDGNGTVVSSGAVSHPGATTGIYRSTLPAQADLKVLDAAWTGTLAAAPLTLHQDYEIVGNLLFTEAEARDSNIVGMQTPLSDGTKYDDAYLARWRSVITETMEERMNRGVIQRYCRARFAGRYKPLNLRNGDNRTTTGTLRRPGCGWDVARIISAEHNGTPITLSELEVVESYVYWNGGSWSPGSTTNGQYNVTIEWEYGPNPVWPETHQRALDLLMINAIPKGYPSSATSISNEDGTFRIATYPVMVEEFFSEHHYR